MIPATNVRTNPRGCRRVKSQTFQTAEPPPQPRDPGFSQEAKSTHVSHATLGLLRRSITGKGHRYRLGARGVVLGLEDSN